MKTFADTTGHSWQVAITLDAVRRVRDLLGVDLMDLTTGEPPLLTRLGTDIVLLCDVIFVVVKPQADAAGVTDAQFGAALGGDTIAEAAEAFWGELADFFRLLRRKDQADAVEVMQRAIQAAVTLAETRIAAVDVAALVATAFGTTSGDSAASSASPTPDR